MAERYQNFAEFYPFYLSQHQNPVCRVLHVIGTALVILVLMAALATGRYGLMLLAPVCGYGFAWVGHFFFEHNRPATFQYPWYSLLGDFRLFFDTLRGRTVP